MSKSIKSSRNTGCNKGLHHKEGIWKENDKEIKALVTSRDKIKDCKSVGIVQGLAVVSPHRPDLSDPQYKLVLGNDNHMLLPRMRPLGSS